MEKFGRVLDIALAWFMVAVVFEVGFIAVGFVKAGGFSPDQFCIRDCGDVLPVSDSRAPKELAKLEEELMNRHFGEAVRVSIGEDGIEVWEFPPMSIKTSEIPDDFVDSGNPILTGTN